MQTTSATYNTLIAASNHRFVVKINIDGTDYGEDEIFSAKQVVKCFDYEPTIGGTYCGTFEFSLLGEGDSIPRMAKVIPYYCVTDGISTSEWIKMGEYYIDTRSITTNGGGINTFDAFCYDAMLKANAKYATSSLAWPATDINVVNEIATKMGVSVDSATATAISNGYSVQLPTEYSMREVLGYIGAMYGGNWIIDTAGKLRLIILGGTYGSLTVGNSVESATFSTQRTAYDKVILNIDENTYVEAGSTENSVMEATCPYATNAIASAVLSTLSTYSYLPFDARGVWSNPAVELGDTCSVAGSTVKIYSIGISYGVGMVMELSAPNDNDIDHEYEYESPSELEYKRTVNNINNSITLNSQGITLISQKLDNFGGRNILLNSATLQWGVVNGATVTHTTGQSVTEWLCNDAIRAVGNCGNINGVCLQMYLTSQTSNVYLADTHYIMSCYIKNNHATKSLWLAANNGTSEEIAPGEVKRAVAEADGDGSTALRMRIYVAQTGDPFDFTYWHPQIECGEVLTAWNPAPEDKVGNNEIISKINVSPENIQIQASKISLAGKAIDLTTDNITITSTNFSVAADGTITATNGNFTGTITSSNATITGGKIDINTGNDLTSRIKFTARNTNNDPGTFTLSILPYQIVSNFARDDGEAVSCVMDCEGGEFGVMDQTSNVRVWSSLYAGRLMFDVWNLTGGSWVYTKRSELSSSHLYFYNGTSSKYTALIDNSSGAGRLVLGDGTSQIWRTTLQNTGLTFRDANDNVTFTYPSYGLYLQDFESKNLCRPNVRVYSNYGVTITVAQDGTTTFSGTTTSTLTIQIGSVYLETGKEYILTGATGGSSSTVFINIPTVVNDTGSGSGNFTVTTTGTYNVNAVMANGANVTGKTFKPMIRESKVTDSTFVPWVKTAEQLTTMRPFEMADCFHQYIQVAGSISFTLKQGVYLVTIGKYSTTDANTNGLYVMTVYNSSSIYAIKSSSAASVSVSGYTVSVTSSQNYVEVSAIKVA